MRLIRSRSGSPSGRLLVLAQTYGDITMKAMADAIERLPRFEAD